MEIRSDTDATDTAADLLDAAASLAGTRANPAFAVHAEVSDAAAAKNHDESTAAFAACSTALARAMGRDAVAIHSLARAFEEDDQALARALAGIS